MNQIKCPDCGAMFTEDMHSCPNCGCPNDNWKPQQEEPQPKAPEETVDSCEDDFNEGSQYSPFSSASWFFTDPWPLKNYPRKAFEKEQPFWGWLFGPWHLTCKNESEKEEYAVINNIFYFFNLIYKTNLYAILWAFFKGLKVLVVAIVAFLFLALLGRGANSTDGSNVLAIFGLILLYGAYAFFLILCAFGIGKSLHRYWPSIHRTWRRINKRYWKAMKA